MTLIHLSRQPGPSNTPYKPTPSEDSTTTTTSSTTATTTLISTRPNHPRPTLANLPPEIHLLITRHLIYPDALSLKHANRHFYQLVDTGVRLKVEWLMERRLLHLECPSDQRCDLGSDLRFCRGSVKLLMQRRREHIECESRPGLGCLIYGTATCPHARKLRTRMKKWLRVHELARAPWTLMLAALVPVLLVWVWMLGGMRF